MFAAWFDAIDLGCRERKADIEPFSD